ncbi:hypothetical protein [Hoylesella shahii]|uniref:hypothetical protein n=1 Tax=Hoylesella shahii TaxID=228603 RepID=UPI00288BA67D|nr:hypothetical protein [Hoylesella shahii]
MKYIVYDGRILVEYQGLHILHARLPIALACDRVTALMSPPQRLSPLQFFVAW